MPPYVKSPIGNNVQQAVAGLPAYAYGSLNRLVAPTRMNITNISGNGTTAQVTGTVIEGNIPVVGQLVSIIGAANTGFNVTGSSITAVSAPATPDVGVYTISFANSTVQASEASTGLAEALQAEVGDVLANGSSQAIALQANTGPNTGQDIRFDVTFPTIPVAATVTAQTADIDLDSEYVSLVPPISIIASSAITGQSAIFDGVKANFVRFNVSSLSGTGKIIAKVTV